ncbi:MAG: flagellar basal body L-ring protein FlgH [Venatoribacter sp.]
MKLWLYLLLPWLLAACTSVPLEPDVYPDDPSYAPVSAESLQAPLNETGSLYQPRYALGLYTDQQARRVGDIITVIFDEAYRSSKSAETKQDKSSQVGVSPGKIFGSTPSFNGITMEMDMNSKQKFSGKGDADRSNSLRGQISVTVSDILPNGVLRIRGEKWLTLSEGDEYIRISGLIRPQDISPTNTVASSKVADARISFGGRGNLNNTTKQGWFGRMMNSPWWPF